MRSPSIHSNNGGGNTGTVRHRHKKSRPAPPPPFANVRTEPQKIISTSELSVGGNNSIKAQWRHQPILLITGVVKYSVNVSITRSDIPKMHLWWIAVLGLDACERVQRDGIDQEVHAENLQELGQIRARNSVVHLVQGFEVHQSSPTGNQRSLAFVWRV